MTDNIEYMKGTTTHDIPIERVLKGGEDLKEIFLLGWDEDDRFYMASSKSNRAELLMLLEIAKKELLDF